MSKTAARSKQSSLIGIREIAFAILAVLVHFLFLGAAVALAYEYRDPAAIKSTSELKPEAFNGNYLRRLSRPVEVSASPLVFDEAVASELAEKYGALEKDYRARQRYQVNGYSDDLRFQQANKDLAGWAMRKLIQSQIKNTRKKVEKTARQSAQSSDDELARGASQAIVVLADVEKALENTTFSFTENLRTNFRYDWPNGIATLGMSSPLINATATMDYYTRAHEQAVGSIKRPEKISLGVTHNFEYLGTSTDVRYGVHSDTLNYGVSRQLIGPVSAQLGQCLDLRDSSRDETLFRLNLGTSF